MYFYAAYIFSEIEYKETNICNVFFLSAKVRESVCESLLPVEKEIGNRERCRRDLLIGFLPRWRTPSTLRYFTRSYGTLEFYAPALSIVYQIIPDVGDVRSGITYILYFISVHTSEELYSPSRINVKIHMKLFIHSLICLNGAADLSGASRQNHIPFSEYDSLRDGEVIYMK